MANLRRAPSNRMSNFLGLLCANCLLPFCGSLAIRKQCDQGADSQNSPANPNPHDERVVIDREVPGHAVRRALKDKVDVGLESRKNRDFCRALLISPAVLAPLW